MGACCAAWQKLEAEGWPSEEERAFVQARVRGVRNLASLLQQTLTGTATSSSQAVGRREGMHDTALQAARAPSRYTSLSKRWQKQGVRAEPQPSDLLPAVLMASTDFRAPDVVAAARVIDGPDRVGVCCGMGLLDPQGSNNGRVCDYEVPTGPLQPYTLVVRAHVLARSAWWSKGWAASSYRPHAPHPPTQRQLMPSP